MLAFLAFAMAQPMLPSDPHDAAMTCARVVASHASTDDAMLGSAQISYFVLQAARAKVTTDGSLFTMMRTAQAELTTNAPLAVAEARPLLPACDARFPQARRQGAVALPTADADRTLICVMNLSVMNGVAEARAEATGDRTALERYSAALRVYQAREDAVLKGTGFATEGAAMGLLQKAVIAGLDIGNPHALSEACIKTL